MSVAGTAIENERSNLRRMADEKGVPFLLDHLGLDGLGNEVNELHRSREDIVERIAEHFERNNTMGGGFGAEEIRQVFAPSRQTEQQERRYARADQMKIRRVVERRSKIRFQFVAGRSVVAVEIDDETYYRAVKDFVMNDALR